MKNKLVPCILFNKTNFLYPRGLRVVTMSDRVTKLESGDWDTGPVDALRGPSPEKVDREAALDAREKAIEEREEAAANDVPRLDDKVEEVPVVSHRKSVINMTVPELTILAAEKNITIEDNWIRKDLLRAIKDYKE